MDGWVKKTTMIEKNDILELEQLRESFGEDPDTFVAILEMFMQEVPKDFDDMVSKMEQEDYYASGLLAHKVKSSYRMLGMETETQLLQEIEDRAKNRDNTHEIPKLFDRYKKIYPEGLKLIMRTIKHLKN